LPGQDGRTEATDLPDDASEIFAARELNRSTCLSDLAKLVFWRMRCRVDPAGQFRAKPMRMMTSKERAIRQCDEIVSTPQRSSCFDETALFLPRSAVPIQ
jgi:hypothetical protein